ncbi:MAG: Long-chain-fatty-acid--CoA ligase, partial [uncultured Solirubrobacteraceae bacterium]
GESRVPQRAEPAELPAPRGAGDARADRGGPRGAALPLRRPRRARRAPGRGAAGRGRGAGGPRCGALAERPGDPRGPLRRARPRRDPRHPEHAPEPAGGGVHPRRLRSPGPHRRPQPPRADGGGGHLRDAGRRGAGHGGGGRPVRGPARERGAGRGRAVRRRRGRPHLDQLHLGHDGPPEGRGVHPPRRLPASPRCRAGDGHERPHGAPLDAADVPLQRLVPDLGGHRGRRPARVPAQSGAGADLGAPGGRGRHPLQRRAHRPPGHRGPSVGPPPRPARHRSHGRLAAVPDAPGPHAGAEPVPRAPLRADGDLRAAHELHGASRVGGAARRGAGCAAGPPGADVQRLGPRARRGRRGAGRPGRRADAGGDRHAGQQRHPGVLEPRGGDGRGLPRRLVSLGGPGRHASRRLRRAARPQEGRDHLGRREHLERGDRAGPRAASRGLRGGGRRDARRAVGRAAEGLRRAAGRRAGRRARAAGLLPAAPRGLQVPRRDRVRRAAADLDRQGAEVPAARARVGRPREGDPV